MRNKLIGRKLSDEHKKKISDSLLKNPPFKGKHHTKKSKKKMSLALKGKRSHLGMKVSDEGRKNISESHKGIKPTEKTKRKISNTLKGRKPWNTGKKLSKEHKNKIKNSMLKNKWKIT